MSTAQQIQTQMRRLGNANSARLAKRFFKTGPGEYGEGDVFLGLRAATMHDLARRHRTLAPPDINTLLQSAIHEERLLALLILVLQMPKADSAERRRIYQYYLANTGRINNWDLVDCSAPQIVGSYLLERSRRPLHRLARSKILWDRRISIVATQHFIRHDDFSETLAIASRLLEDEEDLIHKATGWMLREVGQRDPAPLQQFLKANFAAMPRTMLRYAIERFPPAQRQAYLRGEI